MHMHLATSGAARLSTYSDDFLFVNKNHIIKWYGTLNFAQAEHASAVLWRAHSYYTSLETCAIVGFPFFGGRLLKKLCHKYLFTYPGIT